MVSDVNTKSFSDPSFKEPITEKLTFDSLKLALDCMKIMLEKGFTTPEKIAENIDEFVFGITSLGSFDTGTTIRFGKFVDSQLFQSYSMDYTVKRSKTLAQRSIEEFYWMAAQ